MRHGSLNGLSSFRTSKNLYASFMSSAEAFPELVHHHLGKQQAMRVAVGGDQEHGGSQDGT